METQKYFTARTEERVSRKVINAKLRKKKNIVNARWSVFQNRKKRYVAALTVTVS